MVRFVLETAELKWAEKLYVKWKLDTACITPEELIFQKINHENAKTQSSSKQIESGNRVRQMSFLYKMKRMVVCMFNFVYHTFRSKNVDFNRVIMSSRKTRGAQDFQIANGFHWPLCNNTLFYLRDIAENGPVSPYLRLLTEYSFAVTAIPPTKPSPRLE